ncbi:hypothetical protein MEO94_28200 [Dolichospermum sp. ST_sed9]|nr:hypothetical protein [Dolichospermum sp. ST_sed9]
MINTQDNFNYGDENPIKKRLQESAAQIRAIFLPKKPILTQPFIKVKHNVAVAEVHIGDVVFCAGTTSNKTTTIPIPKSKSEGGQFEPQLDPYSKYMMNACSENKVLSTIADTLQLYYDLKVEGCLYLYTELHPCQSCKNIIIQFEEKFPNMKVEVFWDYPYPPN